MVGQHIGKYRVTSQIGRGGMGTVYRAVDETLQREVAIKVLNAELSDPTIARRFRAEAVTVARLNHPGIATIYELLQHEGQWLMVMEFVRGETFESLAARKGPLPLERAADLMMQALAALTHAHGLGVVHRDLKPANLMLADNGLVKIMDFGIARVAGAEQLTRVGLTMGTPAYMSPEQVLGREVDARADLYAAGLVFYHLTTGRLPFEGQTAIEIAQARLKSSPLPIGDARGDLPSWVSQVMGVALARQPEQRYQTAQFFREALRRGLANLPIEQPAMSAVPPELVATAAPNSLPIGDASSFTVIKHTMPPAAATPTVAAGVSAVERPADAGATNVVKWAGVAAGIVALAAAAYFWMRAPDLPAVTVESSAAPVASSAEVPDATPARVSEPSLAPEFAPAAPASPAPLPPATLPAAPAAAAGTGDAASPRGAAASGPAARRAAAGAPTAPGRPGARGSAAAEVVTAFPGVRAFVVTGRKVEEREASLRLGEGRVSLLDPQGRDSFGSLAYADITAASYSRGRNPLWYPTLAGPSANVDMPGGLFRTERHWLALQSRSDYLIMRLNDDFRRVLDAVGARLSVKIDTMANRGQ